MPGALVVVGKRTWSPLESRLAASIVYRALVKLDRPVTMEELEASIGAGELDRAGILHAISWMRGKGVGLVISPGNRYTEEPSTLSLVAKEKS